MDALASISKRDDAWHSLRVNSTKVIILGHSNGGHGAWYLASRHPDRVLGGSHNLYSDEFLAPIYPLSIYTVVPVAGYIKSQAYVPLTMSRYLHPSHKLLHAKYDFEDLHTS